MRKTRFYSWWTDDEVRRLTLIGKQRDWRPFLKEFPRHSRIGVMAKVRKLSLLFRRENYERWTGSELRTLRDLWPRATKEVIMASIQRHGWGSIQQKARILGAKRAIVFDRTTVRSKVPVIKALVARRKELLLNRKQLADALGYDRVLIERWERGDHPPKLLNLLNWCEALGVELTLQLMPA